MSETESGNTPTHLQSTYFFLSFRAATEAYGSFQLGIELELQMTAYATAMGTPNQACSSARSLTHWVRPGIKPESLQMLVRFLTHWAAIGPPIVPFFFFFFLFKVIPAAYGDSQVRGQIGATAASLCHSQSNAGSKPHLWPKPSSQQGRILNPLSKAKDQTNNLMVPSWTHFCCTTMRTPIVNLFLTEVPTVQRAET